MIYPAAQSEDEEASAKGDVFEGCMEHGMRQGKGTYTWPNGMTYEGEYRDGIKDGNGVLMLPSGERYNGQSRFSFVRKLDHKRRLSEWEISWRGHVYVYEW